MKKIAIIILIIFAFNTTIKATFSIAYLFEHENIRLSLRFQLAESWNYNPKRLHHEALAKVLNDYIKEKIANGKLENKRFEVQVWGFHMGHANELLLTQGRNGYFVSMRSRDTSWENMRAIVHYFARPDWQPVLICIRDHPEHPVHRGRKLGEVVNWDAIFNALDRRISRFFEQNAITDPVFQPVTIWEYDGMSLEFSSDGLRYVINGEKLSPLTHTLLPVRIRDRFLFFYNNGGRVVENMETIQTFEMENRFAFNQFDVHPKWVNIGCCCGWWYSYSYEQNRFFRIENRYRRD